MALPAPYATDRGTGYARTASPPDHDAPCCGEKTPTQDALDQLASSVSMVDEQLDGLLKELNACLSLPKPERDEACANGHAECRSELVTKLQELNGRVCHLGARVAGIRQRIEL